MDRELVEKMVENHQRAYNDLELALSESRARNRRVREAVARLLDHVDVRNRQAIIPAEYLWGLINAAGPMI